MKHSAWDAVLNGDLKFDPHVGDRYGEESKARMPALYETLASIVAAKRAEGSPPLGAVDDHTDEVRPAL